MTVSEIEARGGRAHKLKGAGVTMYPEIGIDVDKPRDLQFAQAILSSGRPACSFNFMTTTVDKPYLPGRYFF